MTPLKLGIIACALAAGMLVTELLWQPVFTVRLTSNISLPLWILAAIYGALQLYLWRMTRRGLALTVDELSTWGDKLEDATPNIVRGYQAHKPVGEIAREIESSHGIPKDVTLRYIIALGKHLRAQTDATA